jgi:hypothetical protein
MYKTLIIVWAMITLSMLGCSDDQGVTQSSFNLSPETNVVSLLWDQPANLGYGNDVSIVGYRLYFGSAPDALANSIDVSASAKGVSINLNEIPVDISAPVFFAVSAINSNNLESRLSNVISN